MSGIVGWISYDSDLRSSRGLAQRMTETLDHRGPDNSRTLVQQHAALGYNGLTTNKVTGQTQPIVATTPRGTIALIYTGYVNNISELRDELRSRSALFEANSDAEAILYGYLEWGKMVAEHLDGMFAIAIWEEQNGQLLLIRDRMGIEPLYYCRTKDGVLFASEAKAILTNPLASKKVDFNGLREVVAFTKPPGWSVWKEISEVEPGTIIKVDKEAFQAYRYWTLRTVRHTQDRDATVQYVQEMLTDIIHSQLLADVPPSVLLSGGLDSSVITGIAADRLSTRGKRLLTFSIDFTGYEEEFSPDAVHGTPDSPYVRDVARMVNSDHSVITLDADRLSDPDIRRAVITARDMPTGRGDLETSLYSLFEAVRSSSHVALSGELADEVFGGYRWMHDTRSRHADTFPWLSFFEDVTIERSKSLRSDLLHMLEIQSYTSDQYATAVNAVEHIKGENELERRMRTVCHLHITRFAREMLDRKDRLSMAVGLQVRLPFSDHRLVQYVYNTPWSMKTFDGREKSILRQAARHAIPGSVIGRAKSGYPSSQDPAYINSLQQQVNDVLTDRTNPVQELVDHDWLTRAARLDASNVTIGVRAGMNLALDLYHWLDMYNPELELE